MTPTQIMRTDIIRTDKAQVAILPLLILLFATACSSAPDPSPEEPAPHAANTIALSPEQLKNAGVATGRIERPADLPPPPRAGATVVPLRAGMPEGP